MDVEFTLKPEDILAAHEVVSASAARQKSRPSLWIVFPVLILFGLSAVFDVPKLWAGDWSFRNAASLLGFLALLPLAFTTSFVRWIQRRQLARAARDGESAFKPVRVSLTGRGFSYRQEAIETLVGWEGIPRITVSGPGALFWTGPKNVLIVPRRAFPGEEDFRRFVETARRLRREASGDGGEEIPDVLAVDDPAVDQADQDTTPNTER